MTTTIKQKLGEKGEQLAADHLEQSGHEIIFRNFRFGRNELDIISLEEKTLVISEVKSYHSSPLGAAEFRVNKAKQKRLLEAANGFLSMYPKYNRNDIRFDVIIVSFSIFPAQITWHKGAFWDEQGWGAF